MYIHVSISISISDAMADPTCVLGQRTKYDCLRVRTRYNGFMSFVTIHQRYLSNNYS